MPSPPPVSPNSSPRGNPPFTLVGPAMKSALCAIAIALTMTAATPAKLGTLPPLPDSVFSAKGWVLVHRDHPVECGAMPPGKVAWGCYTASTRYLAVESTLTQTDSWWVLAHETVHLAARDAGVGYTGIVEEALADAVAARTVAELQSH
jgi:hypothetical protein